MGLAPPGNRIVGKGAIHLEACCLEACGFECSVTFAAFVTRVIVRGRQSREKSLCSGYLGLRPTRRYVEFVTQRLGNADPTGVAP